ncbi:phosphotransferase family protein [Shewanella intestini]|uniref:Phosphotransferase family protein n=1 Tax=Shewanella intestini TaxID=2017544 RepID=A0ABS5I4F2_9GAMM|nr:MULTISPECIES: phosphotransferase family protein [Shewanella]MBR9728903.1 phosphotransferase family protein [Shewanella intestini]MRG37031.1 phosphotransferase [Shewanella sp. XMDDZSB0408]
MNQAIIDKAHSVRQGEELALACLGPWLQSQALNLHGQPTVTQYAGGASNWTYCLSYDNTDVILRRAPAGTKAKGAHDMKREFTLQQALQPVYPYVPNMLSFCDDPNIIGTDFYVMQKLRGIIPRKNLPKDLSTSPQQTQQLCKNVIDCLIELHQVDYQQAGLSHIAKGEGYMARQISGWSKRFIDAKTWNVPSGKFVINWLENNMPANERICLTHNDFRFDNVVLDPQDYTKVIGVLDWELATLGDPLMDLGNMLAYWVEADDDFLAQATRRQPTHLTGMMTRQQVIEYYLEKTAIRCDDFTFYEVYGLFRLAGIVQQIYYRYHHKQTANPAFKQFWVFVHYLLWRCKKAIKAQQRTKLTSTITSAT